MFSLLIFHTAYIFNRERVLFILESESVDKILNWNKFVFKIDKTQFYMSLNFLIDQVFTPAVEFSLIPR